jgi:hypothetical protein
MKMLAISFLLLKSLTLQAAPAQIPDMVLQEFKVLTVNSKTLKTETYESHTVYRISKGELYISSPDREEYLYGKVTEIEPNRFVVGHKTLLFTSKDFKTATLIHSNNTEVKVSKVRGIKTQ